jgi:hypothetical protein
MIPISNDYGDAKCHPRLRFSGGEYPMTIEQSRPIEQIDVCGFCGNGEESTYHALTQCTYAINFWEKLKSLTGIKVPKLNPRTWTRDLLDNSCCKDGDRKVILCGMWSLWNSRNDRRHGKSPIEPRLAVE